MQSVMQKQIATCLVPLTFKSQIVSIEHKHVKTASLVDSRFLVTVNKVSALELK